jgi:hypothetical protein
MAGLKGFTGIHKRVFDVAQKIDFYEIANH